MPCTIGLLDPPPHEFPRRGNAEFDALAEASGVSAAYLKRRTGALHEANPMLGQRGCRLGFAFPEIYQMQTRAIFERAGEYLLARTRETRVDVA